MAELSKPPVQLVAGPAFDLSAASVGTAGVLVSECDVQLATVIAHDVAACAHALNRRYQLDAPRQPRRVASADLAVLGVGPRTFWMTREGGAPLADELAELFGEGAAVTDQSDGYALLRLSGPKLRDTLAKGFMIDLHPRVFEIGHVASTSCAHIGATIWRLDDAGGFPVFETAVFRSYADSFMHWLQESAAEFGWARRGSENVAGVASGNGSARNDLTDQAR